MSVQTASDEPIEGEIEIYHGDSEAIATLNKSELMSQMEVAHRFRRSVKQFQQEALTLATLNQEVAASCMYGVPRDGKIITGPSVRFSEIIQSTFKNMHVASRVLDAEEKFISAQGVAWDMENNVRVVIEVKRRITGKKGNRFGDDMIATTGAAAAAIARRNAVFQVVPRALVDELFAKVKQVAVGDAKTLAARRQDVVGRLQKIGVPVERIWARLNVKGIQDVGLEELEVLIGLGTAITSKNITIDDAFPEPDDTAAKAKELDKSLTGKGQA